MFESVEWIAPVGVLLPLVTSLIKRPGWSDTAKRAVAIVVAVVAGVVTVGVDQGWAAVEQFMPVLEQSLAVWVVAQTAYAHLWKDTTIESNLAGSEPEPAKPPAI